MKEIVLAVVMIVIGIGLLLGFTQFSHIEETKPGPVGCIEDAKICNDGTVLTRNPNNNCEFPECPIFDYEDATGLEQLQFDLRSGGAIVAPDGLLDQPFAPVPARLVNINGEDVQVFEFDTAREAEDFRDSISSDATEIGTTLVAWVDEPHLYHRDTIIVLYVGTKASTQNALTQTLGNQFAGGIRPTECSPESRNAEFCIEIFQPVCGQRATGEQKTYSNSCFACMDDAVLSYVSGACLQQS